LSTCSLLVLGLSACALMPDTAKLHDVAPGPGVPLPVPRPHFAHIRPRHRVVASMPLLRGTMAPVESQRSPNVSSRKAVPVAAWPNSQRAALNALASPHAKRRIGVAG